MRRYVGHHARLFNGLNSEGKRLRKIVGHNAVEIMGGHVLGGLLGYAMSLLVEVVSIEKNRESMRHRSFVCFIAKRRWYP